MTMQVQTQVRNRRKSETARSGRVITSYTCPRCRQYSREGACPRCGWSPEESMLAAQSAGGHEDRIIAC